MTRVESLDGLLESYGVTVARPWDAQLASPYRTWLALYPPPAERRLRAAAGRLEEATRNAGHGWVACDFSRTLADWLGNHRYREAYFASPHDLRDRLKEFREVVSRQLAGATGAAGFEDVVALFGLASLWGFISPLEVVEEARSAVRGRLLVLFPGERAAGGVIFLDGRDPLEVPEATTVLAEGHS